MSRTHTDEVSPARHELSQVSSSRRLLRLRAVAAALAVGGFASLGVVLLGPPSDTSDSSTVTTIAESDAVAPASGERPDIVLGNQA